MIRAPFTPKQVEVLNEFQNSGVIHPFTCAECGRDLLATEQGWICSTLICRYTQDWAHAFMASREALETMAEGTLYGQMARMKRQSQ